MFNIIPNPLSNKESLVGLAKKTEVITETFSFFRSFAFISVSLLITLYVLSNYDLPLTVIVLMATYVFVSGVISQIVKVWKINSINTIPEEKQGKSYHSLTLINLKYKLVNSVISLILTLLTVLQLRILVPEVFGVNIFIIEDFVNFSLENLFGILILFRVVEIVLSIIEYSLNQGISSDENFAEVQKKLGLLNKKIEFIKFIIYSAFLLIIFNYLSIPPEIIKFVVSFMLMWLVLSLVEIIRIQKLDLNILSTKVIGLELKLEPDEKLLYTIFGIMNLGRTGTSILGVGSTNKPENTLIITNKRMLFVEIPIAGNSAMVDGITYSDMNFFWNRGELINAGGETLKTFSLNEIANNYGVQSYLYDDISKLILKKMEIEIHTIRNDKVKYLFLDREHIQPLIDNFKAVLGEKFVLE